MNERDEKSFHFVENDYFNDDVVPQRYLKFKSKPGQTFANI